MFKHKIHIPVQIKCICVLCRMFHDTTASLRKHLQEQHKLKNVTPTMLHLLICAGMYDNTKKAYLNVLTNNFYENLTNYPEQFVRTLGIGNDRSKENQSFLFREFRRHYGIAVDAGSDYPLHTEVQSKSNKQRMLPFQTNVPKGYEPKSSGLMSLKKAKLSSVGSRKGRTTVKQTDTVFKSASKNMVIHHLQKGLKGILDNLKTESERLALENEMRNKELELEQVTKESHEQEFLLTDLLEEINE